MNINRNSQTPLYQQLAQAIRRCIETGEFRRGDAIPAESELMRDHRVSRVTVRKALDLLVADGLLVRRQGKGTFVRSPLVEERLASLQGFAELMVSVHPRQVMEVLAFEFRQAPDPVRAALALSPGSPVLRIVRRHILAGIPIACATIFLPASIGRLFSADEVSATPIYSLIQEKSGASIKRATQTIRATGADADAARCLQVTEGAPLLSIRRITYSMEEKPLEYIELRYRGDRHELTIDLYRNPIENLLHPVRNVVTALDAGGEHPSASADDFRESAVLAQTA